MIRVFEAFAGVGSQRMALRNIGIEHEVVAIAEIDKYAIKSYEAIHGETNNLGDISQIETADIPDHDLFTYSFPCQDISVAGKGLGLDEGSATRSGLLWECQKVIAVKKPKYLLLENVKNLVGKKHKHNFDKWLEWLEGQGYTNYHQILNAKDYGVPQNRERVFVVSVLGEHEPYEFPEPVELELRLKDVLEEEVDEKFYLDEEKVNKLIINSDTSAIGYIPRINGTQHQSNTIYKTDAESPSMQARDYKDPVKVLIKNATKKGYLEATHGDGVDLAYPESKTRRGRVQEGLSQTLDTGDSKGVVVEAKRIGGIFDKDGTKHQAGAVWDKEQLAPTLDTMQGGWRQPSVVVDNKDIKPINPLKGKTDNGWHFEQQVYDENGITRTVKAGGGSGNIPKVIAASRGRNPNNPSDRTVGTPTEQRLEINKQGTSNTITTVQKDNYVVEQVRRLADSVGVVTSNILTTVQKDKYEAEIVKDFDIPKEILNDNERQRRVYNTNGISPSVLARTDSAKIHNYFRIRKLTPKECWRLMGFKDEDFEKASKVVSNTQLYKQAGNSVVVNVLEAIFSEMFIKEEKRNYQTDIFDFLEGDTLNG